VGGTQDILVHEVYGLFAEPHHPSDLARQIERFLENPAWARELARAGQHYVHREFRAEVADARMLELYLKLQGRAR
jgi:glycosyltransferase involved in cell wall biosynthesis